MSFKCADVKQEYAKNKGLREEDVKALREWAEKQAHLPTITELQLILFLQSCYYSIELAKTTLDTYFTIKPLCPELFAGRDPQTPKLKEDMKVGVYHELPDLTPEGYRVIFCKLIDLDPSKYNYTDQLRIFDMSLMLTMAEKGTAEGLIILMDMKGLTFAHLTKVTVMGMKKFMYYLQEAMPVRLKGLHFINVVSFMDKVLALMKPFMKKELMDMLYIHSDSIESLYKHVPKNNLPNNYGGSVASAEELQQSMQKRLCDAADYFREEEKQVADESKRQGKPKNAGEIFGVEGSFKKLDID